MADVKLSRKNGDLRKIAAKKYGVRVVKLLILIAVLVAAYIWYFAIDDKSIGEKLIAVAAFAAIAAVGVWRFKVYEMFTDTGWEGEIVSSDLETIKFPIIGEDGEKIVTTKMLHVKMKDEKGREHKYDVNCDGTDYSGYYVKGERVRHYHGFDRPVVVDSPSHRNKLCIACGTLYNDGTDVRVCGNCRRTMVDFN